MKEYTVKYITLERDVDTALIEAYNKEDAKKQLKKEYWNVREVLSVREV